MLLFLWQENFKEWNDAIQTKNPKKAAAMYSAEELSFLPTVSPNNIHKLNAEGKEEDVEGYFVEFMKKDPYNGVITDEDVQVLMQHF